MLAFDLSSTPLAISDEIGPVPTDCELCAILNALLVVERCSFQSLRHRALVLDDRNVEDVARATHSPIPLVVSPCHRPPRHPRGPRLVRRAGPSFAHATRPAEPMSDYSKDNTELSEVVADLVEILRDLRSVIDPAGAVRPLNIAEAARAMRCRRSDVQRLIDRGAIPCIRRNGRRYVLPSDVGQWLRNEAGTNGAQNQATDSESLNRRRRHRPCAKGVL